MSHYVYSPFVYDRELMESTVVWTQRREKYIRLTKDLYDVPEYAQLYIIGHGKIGSNLIYDSNKKSRGATPQQLADDLISEKLSKDHMTIKVFVCYSGLAAFAKEGLAYKLWECLKKARFNQLTVYGYTVMVSEPVEDVHPKTKEIGPRHLHKRGLVRVRGNLVMLPGTARDYSISIDPNGVVRKTKTA